jgi:hypothetical protein
MGFDASLETFRNNISNIVRPNKFIVEVHPPKILGVNGKDIERLVYYAQSASIPDRSFSDIQIKFYSMEYKIPAGEIIQDLTVNFIVDDKWFNRSMFEAWANLMNDRTGRSSGNAIKTDVDELFDAYVVVKQLNFKNEIISDYKYVYIFPKTVGEIELHQDNFDTYETFPVTFAYSYWE